MDQLFQVDWNSIFVPTTSLVEIFIRGTLVYLLLFFVLRFLRRETGAIGIADLLVIVIIADAAQNAMAGEYKSVTEGAVLVATIAFWDYTLDGLGYRFPWIRRLLRAAPLPLIKNGRMLRRNMRQEMITEEELLSQLRQQGIERVSDVKKAYLEDDGRFSIILNGPKDNKAQDSKAKPG
ncbi:MAG: DUF421 domain-containing protein [Chloroflexota bacterium]|nr:MAG: DUF421 domain-containing protein [Chloroflexota bacterium]